MRKVDYGGIKIAYFDKSDIVFSENNIDYAIAETDSEDMDRISHLISNGFVFHNRTILAEINPFKTDEKYMKMIRFDVKSDTEYCEDMLTIAGNSFVKDRRFHLEQGFSRDGANKIIKGYLEDFHKQNHVILKSFHKEQLVGFIVLKKMTDNQYENVMGVVSPEYQSRGVAVSLYAYMIKYLRSVDCKRVYGRISAVNTASINLHIALGAVFSIPQDTYIKRFHL